MKKITTEKAYDKALSEVYELIKKGENNLTEKDDDSITAMASAIQDFEKVHYPFPVPKTMGRNNRIKNV